MAKPYKPKQKKGGRPSNTTNNKPINYRTSEDVVKGARSRESMKGEMEDMRKGISTASKYNDISWYSHNPQMLRDSGNYSFNAPLGLQLPAQQMFNSANAAYTIDWGAKDSVPGLMRMIFAPTIGVSTTSTSPANLAAQNIYSYVRYMNSGAKNYDQADLMLYLLAMDSIYMVWNWMKRMYGYARTYSPYNRYMPRAYARADLVDFEDLQSNLADYRAQMNALASRISSFCVPAVMPYFIRHSWLASNIYADSNNVKAQQYIIVPGVCYKYDEAGSKFGGQLIAQYTYQTGVISKFQWYIDNLLTPMLDAIAYSEDIGVMSGDILKAYGQDKLFKISPLEPDYIVEAVYNEEVLNQLHNSSVCPLGALSQLNVTQDPNTGFLVYDPTLGSSLRITRDAILFNCPWNNPTVDNVMIGTRLSSTLYSDGTNYRLGAVGSEFIYSRAVIDMATNGTLGITEIPEYCVLSDTSTATANAHLEVLNQIRLISNFDWHPLWPVWHVTGTSNTAETWRFSGWIGDIDMYTVIPAYELRTLHETALMSLFNVPQLGSF